MPGSILVVCYDTTTGRYLVQKAGSAQITDESITSAHLASGAVIGDRIAAAAITSAKIASGAVGTVHMYPGAVTSSILASGQVGIPHIYHGAIISAKIASGIIGGVHLVDATITSAKIASGIIGGPLLQDQGVLSAKIASGIIGGALLQDLGIVSGKYAADSITEQALVSGISIDISEVSQEPSYRAGELISAYQGVQFSTSGYFGLAKITAIDTMPAIGVAIANIASGSIGTFQYQGRMTNPNWDFSGYVGNLLFLGSGQCESEVTLTAPAASGESVQRVAKVVGEDTVFVRPELVFVQIAE